MRQKHWSSLYIGLTESISSRSAIGQFSVLQCEPVIARFDSLAALHAYLRSRPEDLDQRDQVFAAIIRVLQTRRPAAQLAYTLLWCGLWPGLDHVYQRRLPAFAGDSEELTAEICAAFARIASGMNLGRVQRVAATLVRNVDRQVAARAHRRRADEARRIAAAKAAGAGPDRQRLAGIGAQPALRIAGEFVALRVRLGIRVGVPSDFLGLSDEAARKRVQRALRRILSAL